MPASAGMTGLGARLTSEVVIPAKAESGSNDARCLRDTQSRERLLAEMVRQAGERFRGARQA